MSEHNPNAPMRKTANAQWWAITSVVVDILIAYSSKVVSINQLLSGGLHHISNYEKKGKLNRLAN
ncbi:hypothetical protein K151_1090 [Proteus hauseri ZMd44]|nr:hypothetical protein K151_1090 [Proteus hauseri ZMd44]